MKQIKPIIHGRDHALGGADPIPGLNGGGGALEWEDVGLPGAMTDPWLRHSIVTGSTLTFHSGSGEITATWAGIAHTYSPEGTMVDFPAVSGYAAGEHIRLLLPGFYHVAVRVFSNSLQPSTYYAWALNPGSGSYPVEYGTNLVPTNYIPAGGPGSSYPYVYFWTELNAPAAQTPCSFRFRTSGANPPWTSVTVVAFITRLST